MFQSQNLNKLKNLLLKYESESFPETIKDPPEADSLSIEAQRTIAILKAIKQENKDLQSKILILQESFNILQKKHNEALEAHSLEKLKYEGTIARNLTMIENLLQDKQNLNEEIEKIMKEKNEAEHKKTEIVSFYREKLKNELKNQKENIENLEKNKRKQWYAEKTKEIKDLTVRGLEPELARILEGHKKEMKGLEEKYQKEVEEEKEKLRIEFEENKKHLILDFDYKDEMRRRIFDSQIQEELRKNEALWVREKERMLLRFEEELHQKEMQRTIEKENFELKLKLLSEKP